MGSCGMTSPRMISCSRPMATSTFSRVLSSWTSLLQVPFNGKHSFFFQETSFGAVPVIES